MVLITKKAKKEIEHQSDNLDYQSDYLDYFGVSDSLLALFQWYLIGQTQIIFEFLQSPKWGFTRLKFWTSTVFYFYQ